MFLDNIIDVKYIFNNLWDEYHKMIENHSNNNIIIDDTFFLTKLKEFQQIIYKITDIKKNLNDDKKISKRENKNLYILDRYPIKKYKEIAEKTRRNKDSITIDEIIEYIIDQEGFSQKSKSRLKYKFERCTFLYNKY